MEIIILGGGGDASVISQIINDIDRSGGAEKKNVGILDDSLPKGSSFLKLPVLGVLDCWPELSQNYFFIPALQKIKKMPSRSQRILGLRIPESRWTNAIHPSACVADDVPVGFGTTIASHVTVNPGARIGNFVSIRAGANIGHDAVVEDFSYIGPNATMNGFSRLGYGSSLGPNSVILENVTVSEFCVIGIGSAVTKAFPAYSILTGNPCQLFRKYRDHDAATEAD